MTEVAYPLVWVKWSDSAGIDRMDKIDLEKATPCIMYSAGWLLRNEEEQLVLAQDYYDDFFRDALVIPKHAVITMQVYP